MRKSPEKGREEEVRRKQIETTLTELHRLQAEIYDLNIPDNPHSSAPVKKEVKQLTYLYENMISTPTWTQSQRPRTVLTYRNRTSQRSSISSRGHLRLLERVLPTSTAVSYQCS